MKEVAGGDGEAAAVMLPNGMAARPSMGCALDVLQGDMYVEDVQAPRSTMMMIDFCADFGNFEMNSKFDF